MSNKIFGTDIVDQSASVEVKKLQTDLVSLLNTFIQTSGAVDLMRKALTQNVTGYNNVSDALNNNTKALDEMTRVKNQVIALQRQIDVMNSSEYKQLIELREVRNKNNRELREEAKSVVYASDAYKKLEQEYSKAAREAKNLGAELGLNNKQFLEAAQRANTYHDKLKAIDASMGQHTRKVGQYENATHSLSQVLREMPSFTYSAQTGILALSNNLPILADEFMAVRAETGSTVAALKVFGSSLLTFGNIFTIAIGLVTIFWDKIVGAGDAAKEASEDIKSSGDALQMAYNSSDFKQALTNVTELETRIGMAKAGFADKDQVVKFYNETIGKTTGLVNDLDEAERELTANSDQYLKMILLRAAAHIALEQAAKKAVEAESTRRKELEKIDPEKGKYGGFLEDIKHLASDDGKSMAESAVDNVNKMVDGIQEEGQKLEDIGKKFMRDAMTIANSMGFNFNDDNRPDKKKKDKKPVNRMDAIKQQFQNERNLLEQNLNDQKISYESYYDALSMLADKYRATREGLRDEERDSEIEFNTELSKISFDAYQKILEILEKESEATAKVDDAKLKKAQETSRRIYENNKRYQEQELDLIKEWERGYKDFFDNLEEQERKLWEKRLKYAQYAKDITGDLTSALSSMYDIQHAKEISQLNERAKANQAYYDEEEKRIKIQFTNKAEQERELARLEAQRAAQEKAIERERLRANRKRAQQQKTLDISNIITTTALAVMGALSRVKTDGPIAYAQAAAIGVKGAAELAKAIATPLPEYKEGTGPDGHKGGLAIVGDGGVPEYIEEPGKKGYWSKPFAQVVDIPAKTIVTPPEKLMEKLIQNTMANLGKRGVAVNEFNYQDQMLAEFEAMTKELRETKETLKRLKIQSTTHIDFNHELWVNNNIR